MTPIVNVLIIKIEDSYVLFDQSTKKLSVRIFSESSIHDPRVIQS